MKQQVKPGLAIGISVGAIALIGLLVWFFTARANAPDVPKEPVKVEESMKGLSPQEQINARMKQMQGGGQQGGGGK